MHKVTLANGVNFRCSESETILEAAKANNVAIEYSCATGRCGVCAAPLLNGKTKNLKAESALSNDEAFSAEILTCCRSPLSDILLDVEDLGEIAQLKVLTMPCRVAAIDFINQEVLVITFRFPPNSNFKFFSGQYVNLISGDVKRSYSIANAPRADNRLELQIKKVSQGSMSEILFSGTKENDLFRIEGPLGTFSYREKGEGNIILMATGTGIAPIKALLESFSIKDPQKEVFVVWGGRHEKDLYFDVASAYKNLTYVPVLSRENRSGYFYGYVQDAVLDLGLELAKCSVYACGSEAMIKDARKSLLGNGLSEKRFHSDAFVSSNQSGG